MMTRTPGCHSKVGSKKKSRASLKRVKTCLNILNPSKYPKNPNAL